MIVREQQLTDDYGPSSGASGAVSPQIVLAAASAPTPLQPEPKVAEPAKPEVERTGKDLRVRRKAARERFTKQTKSRKSGINL